MTRKTKGTLLTLIAGVAWGLSGVSGQFLMEKGLAVELVTALRLLLSGIFLLSLSFWRAKGQLLAALKDSRAWREIVAFAVLGLVLNQVSYLTAIHLTNAGTATVLQYLSPILILGYACAKERQLPTGLEIMAIFLAITGTFLMATHGEWTGLAITPQGFFWGLLSAVTYVFYVVIPIRVIRQYGSIVIMGIGMTVGGLLLAIVRQVWLYTLPLDGDVLMGLGGIIGLGTIVAYTLFLKGVSMIGPVQGSLLASIEPIAAVFFAVLLLKEKFYAVDLLGMGLIFLGVLLISLKDVAWSRKKVR